MYIYYNNITQASFFSKKKTNNYLNMRKINKYLPLKNRVNKV